VTRVTQGADSGRRFTVYGRNGDTRKRGASTLPTLLLVVLAAGVLAGAAIHLDHRPHASLAGTILYVLAGFLVVAAATAPFVAASMRQARDRQRAVSREELRSITEAADEIREPALAKLIAFNFRLMDRFIDVALGQAKAAYLFCAGSACAALLVLLIGTAALLSTADPAAQVAVGVLRAAGAALSGFISITFMRTFAMTSRQMSYYYGQPLVHCYLLHAEWLAKRAAGHETRQSQQFDDLLVRSTIRAGEQAQHHLLELLQVKGVPDAPLEFSVPEPATAAPMNGATRTPV
jgi:hypothetical protein